jgi:predicted membrane protein
VLTESPELLEQTKPPKDSISPAEYQKRMKAGLITLYIILGIIVLAALFVIFVRIGAAGALAGIVVGGIESIKTRVRRGRTTQADAPEVETEEEESDVSQTGGASRNKCVKKFVRHLLQRR